MNPITRLYRGENNYNFQRFWKIGMWASVAFVLISLLSLATRGLNLGIDFEGGVSWMVKAPGVTVEQTRDAMRPLGLAEGKIQILGGENVRVQGPADTAERQNEVRAALAGLAGVADTSVSVSTVGPTWGGEVTISAVRALFIFLAALALYVTLTFRGEWKMAVGVLVAVVHDVIISVGVYSVFGFEVTPATVIAFLTILGFSIYDTVVVYDKVLENTGRVGVANRMTYSEMMNLSLNQVLLRSINTSVVAVLPVLAMLIVGSFILGAVTLQEFAIALTVGMIVGVYSSIMVAAPTVAFMKEREPRYRQLRERLSRTGPLSGTAVPATVGAGVGSATGTGAATGETVAAGAAASAYSRNHPPRPRKKGKRK